MKLRFVLTFLFTYIVLVVGATADNARLSKAQELIHARDLVSRLSAANRLSKRPIVGVLNYWEVRINTYSDDFEQQLERSTMYPLYYDCCRAMERLYEGKPTTYHAEDSMGYPSQMTIVEFDDTDFGKSHLIVGLWEGNDSTGFYFLHLPGAYKVKETWKKRESWSLEGIFMDAKKPAEQVGTAQPATAPESKSEGGDKPQPESEPAPR